MGVSSPDLAALSSGGQTAPAGSGPSQAPASYDAASVIPTMGQSPGAFAMGGGGGMPMLSTGGNSFSGSGSGPSGTGRGFMGAAPGANGSANSPEGVASTPFGFGASNPYAAFFGGGANGGGNSFTGASAADLMAALMSETPTSSGLPQAVAGQPVNTGGIQYA